MHLSKAAFEVLWSKTSQLCLSDPHPILCSQRRQVAAERIRLAGVVSKTGFSISVCGPGHEISGPLGTGKSIPSGEAGI